MEDHCTALFELEGKPMPKDSPCNCTGKNPGNNKRKSKRPPQNKDSRGAGGAIGPNEALIFVVDLLGGVPDVAARPEPTQGLQHR